PFNRLAEVSETNNVATATVTIRTRPDLSIPALALSDDEPVAGETVTVTLTIHNNGQTAAGPFAVSLMDGNTQYPISTLQLPAATSAAVSFAWTPTTPGPYRLFARADRDNAINEYDEGNNDAWRDVYVGFGGPIRVDAGAASDPTYTPAAGFGYLNTGTRTVSCGGSAAADATLRAAITSTLLYRFDHLLPGHFYHLDLTLRDCDGSRAEEVWVDGMPVAPATDLSDHQPHRLSLLLDPALYRDRTITAAIVETHGLDAQVAEISLHDVDYRYADAGHSSDPNDPADPRYPGPAAAQARGRAYGWLDGERLASWGNLPGQTVRMDRADDDPADDPDSELRYRFDGLDPARRYRLRLTFRQLSGASVIQKVQLDGTDATPSFTLASGQAYSLTVAVPPMAYDADGSIVVGVVRVDCAASEAQVNEIALEEETLPAGNPCNVRPTPNRTLATGRATIRGVPAPAGAVIEAVTPRDEVAGCAVVSTAGEYPLMHIYGADPTIPGMRDGEIVEFRINGIPAVAQPSLYWKNDSTPHTVDLSIGSTEGQCSWLASGWNLFSFRLDPPVPTVEKALGAIAGRYCQVRGERAAYDCTQDPVYRTLKELDPGQSYWLKLEGSAGANLRIEGMSVPITTPLPLHQYWNWVGYLPTVAQPITAALQSIAGRYLLVLSKDKTYDPNNPGRSTLWTLEPGQGYQIRATEAVTLVYPAAVSAAGLPPAPEDAGPGAAACSHVSPTPFLTLLYGQARLGAAPAPAGAVVEIVTPRG
ncbi:MAG: CARDB domain-containing protein, partial [Anaerolineae bacterium]